MRPKILVLALAFLACSFVVPTPQAEARPRLLKKTVCFFVVNKPVRKVVNAVRPVRRVVRGTALLLTCR
jgi:hypothetical protein